MKKLPILTKENGFTLIESVITVFLVTFMVSGLFSAWYVVEKRDRNLEQYWQNKETLELAYQITHQTLRAKARLATITIISGGQGITFTGTDNNLWTFIKEGNNYKLTHADKDEILIPGICSNVLFTANNAKVDIFLEVTTPLNWTGTNDLNINGTVYVRNP
jgi:type II secretory pathway pseudopilin PulG